MSSQNDEESDVQDVEIIDYTNEYIESQKSSEVSYSEIKDNDIEPEDDNKSDENNISRQDSISNKQSMNYRPIFGSGTADDEEIVKSCMLKASKINEKIMNQRKQLKDQFKEFQNTLNAARSNLKDYDMPYQTAHFPLYLKTQEKFVILPAQNLNIRKGTVESFIKTNLENENSVKKAEQDRRVAFKQRRPYQRRKFDS
ncbi:unnamed protein product [Paramecium sonneborni]|uniref:Uncharacterized protein n=1 Tax=Paramecium sonneborni TaxID=65129 RepID=A0A8S1QH11_9CILI|nr:unnamed protein product [Paramecium sonneborni]